MKKIKQELCWAELNYIGIDRSLKFTVATVQNRLHFFREKKTPLQLLLFFSREGMLKLDRFLQPLI